MASNAVITLSNSATSAALSRPSFPRVSHASTITSSPTTSSSLMPLFSRRALTLARPLRRHQPRRSSAALAAVRPDTATWTRAPLTTLDPASADGTLFHITIDVSDNADLASSHTVPGQYLQLRLPTVPSAKPSFLAIASAPSLASAKGELEFLVKKVPGSTAELLCDMRKGEVVELSAVMGKGFPLERISPPEAAQTVFIFATGSGISPIRSLIEAGFNADKRSDVRLFYGARNLQRMAYQDRFKDWETSGVRIIPVLSQPDGQWEGEQGYVQAAFLKTKQLLNPLSTGAVLCGHKQMAEDVISALEADGVSRDKILMNF